jgi:hypothetical protein
MMKVHRREKHRFTKYRYGITKYMPGVPETPTDQFVGIHNAVLYVKKGIQFIHLNE